MEQNMADQTTKDPEKARRDFVDAKRGYDDAIAVAHTNTGNIVVLNFKALQLLRIKSLQQELFDFQMELHLGLFSANDYDRKVSALDDTLQKYGQSRGV